MVLEIFEFSIVRCGPNLLPYTCRTTCRTIARPYANNTENRSISHVAHMHVLEKVHVRSRTPRTSLHVLPDTPPGVAKALLGFRYPLFPACVRRTSTAHQNYRVHNRDSSPRLTPGARLPLLTHFPVICVACMEGCLAQRPQRNRRRHFGRGHRRQACWTGQEEPITGVRWGTCGRGETRGTRES